MRVRGVIERMQPLPYGYACLGLRELMGRRRGARLWVYVPALVLVRDGFPGVDEVIEVELCRHAGEGLATLPDGVNWCAVQICQRLGVLGDWGRPAGRTPAWSRHMEPIHERHQTVPCALGPAGIGTP